MDQYAGWDSSFFEEEYVAPEYLGLTRAEAEARGLTHEVAEVRVADLDVDPAPVLFLDLMVSRLTLLVHHGRVVRAGFL